MDVFLYTAAEAFAPEAECQYSFITSYKNYTIPHTHEFYEFFIITEGKVIHKANHSSQVLQDGSLVFMRPHDIHFYEKYQNFNCKWINMTFSSTVFHDLQIYLGDDFPWDTLLVPTVPPSLLLSKTEKRLLIQRLGELNLLPVSRKHMICTEFRTLLVDMFVRYFNTVDAEKSEQIPQWLRDLCEMMARKENFVSGLDAMKSLSGKTHEHLCRLFRRHFTCTPTEYVNSLRLNYAANMLINSDMDILNISMDSGFDNLSHFYHVFKNEFGTSPSAFRKVNQRGFYI